LPIIEKNILNYEKIQYETVMLSLRMTKGLSLKRYRKSIGRDFQLDYNDKISELSKYLLITEDHICVKPEYMGILNSILVELL